MELGLDYKLLLGQGKLHLLIFELQSLRSLTS